LAGVRGEGLSVHLRPEGCRISRVLNAAGQNRLSVVASIVLVEEHEVFKAIGDDGFTRLIAAFYRQIPNDDILGPLYKGRDLAAAEKRLRDFLIYRFGGPQQYIEDRGHPRLRMRHAPFAIDQAARNRWMTLMKRALEETKLPEEAAQVLETFFDSTATAMLNRVG
jgi:hemoglobin